MAQEKESQVSLNLSQKKDNHQSYREPNVNKNCEIFFESRVVKIPKIGKVIFKDRAFPKWWSQVEKLCSMTVSKSCSGNYYVSILFEITPCTYKVENRKDCSSVEIGYTFDFSFNVVVYMHNNKIVLQNFISRGTDDFLKEYFKDYKDYSFYDYSDGGVGRLTKKRKAELEEIGGFYESLFDDTGIPANVGLSFEMFSDDDVYDLVSQLEDALGCR